LIPGLYFFYEPPPAPSGSTFALPQNTEIESPMSSTPPFAAFCLSALPAAVYPVAIGKAAILRTLDDSKDNVFSHELRISTFDDLQLLHPTADSCLRGNKPG
jgi:hypothetical protein